jgi:hypothetical protein
MNELSEKEVLMILTIVDLLGKSTDGLAVRRAFERAKKKWSTYLQSQVPQQQDYREL